MEKILPIIEEHKLKKYEVCIDEKKLTEYLEELEEKLSSSGIFIAEEISDDINNLEEAFRQILNKDGFKNDEFEITSYTEFEYSGGKNMDENYIVDIKNFPYFTIAIKRILNSEIIDLTELKKFFKLYFREEDMNEDIIPNLEEYSLTLNELKEFISVILQNVTVAFIDEKELDKDVVLVRSDASVEDFIEAKKLLEIGSKNTEALAYINNSGLLDANEITESIVLKRNK